MNPKTTLPISQARKNIFKLSDRVQKPGIYFTLTEKGRPKVVLLSAEEFDSIMETMEILSDQKVLKKIKKAEAEFAKGEYITWEKAKKELGFKKK